MRGVGLAAVAALALSGCGSDNNTANAGSTGADSCPSGSLTGQGSTFQQNIEKQWISQFSGRCSGAHVTYTGTGSSAGIQQFGSGTIDFAGSDAVMESSEQAAADSA